MQRSDFHPMREADPKRRHPVFQDATRLIAVSRDDMLHPERDDRCVTMVDDMLLRAGVHDPARRLDLTILAKQMTLFAMVGRNVVTADPLVEAMLERTDLGALRVGNLRLPHMTTYVAFGRDADLALPDGSDRRIDGAYVTYDEVTLLLTLTTSPGVAVDAEPIRAWPHDGQDTFMVRARVGDESRLLSDVVDRDLVSSVYDGEFRALIGKLPAGPEREDAIAALDAKADERGRLAHVIRRGVMLALNVLSYMTAKPDDVERSYTDDVDVARAAVALDGGRKSLKARQKLMSEGRYPVVVVGRRASRSREAQAFATGMSVKAHARRGHVRNQRRGKGLTEVEVIWIWPTVVNGGPGDGRVYKVVERTGTSHGGNVGELAEAA